MKNNRQPVAEHKDPPFLFRLVYSLVIIVVFVLALFGVLDPDVILSWVFNRG